MGMFSWLCLGCHGELCEGEQVRLAGRREVYDGYGGSMADTSTSGACWHEACYQEASTETKLNDSLISKHASNQGMGYPKLKFLPGYDPAQQISYYCRVDANWTLPEQAGEQYSRFKQGTFYFTDDGWKDQESWEAEFDDMRETYPSPADLNDIKAWDARYQAILTKVGSSPLSDKVIFNSEEACLTAAASYQDAIVPKLPTCDTIYLKVVIFGSQVGTLHGEVISKEWKWESEACKALHASFKAKYGL
jgi:hypothetical protein